MEEFIEFKLHGRNFRYYSVDRIDSERNYKNKSYWKPVSICNNQIYKQFAFRVDGKKFQMMLHRVIYYAHNQEWNIYDISKDNKIDHKIHEEGIPLDNSISNLRVVNTQQNAFNRNCKGYYFDKRNNKYLAHIGVDGKKKYLGSYNTEEEAHKAYLDAKAEYHVI